MLNWFFIIFAAFLILKPLVYNPIISRFDLEKARKLILAYGQNPASYLALENDKKYFFGSSVEGVAAFTVVDNVAVCCGDIICDQKDSLLFISEFMSFCRRNGWDITLINVTDKFLPLYKEAGFGFVKYGEDAMFELANYNLQGGKVAKVRAAINHASNIGITVREYKPNEKKDFKLEHEINEVSNLWLASKKGPELAFMLGNVNLSNPMDRRYFIAADSNDKLMGFVIFYPFNSGEGYMADVTRRLPDAPQGVLEKNHLLGIYADEERRGQVGQHGAFPSCKCQGGGRVGICRDCL